MEGDANAFRIVVDHDVCIGSAMCVALAPRVFALDETGVARVIDAALATLEVALEAEEDCPSEAIVVTRGDSSAR